MILFIAFVDFNFVLYCLDEEKDNEAHLVFLKLVIVVLCSYVQATTIFQCLTATCLYVTLYKKCFFHIERALKQRIVLCQNKQICQRLTRLYLGLTYNYQQLVVYMNPAFTIWWLVLMSILILSFYFLIVVYIDLQFGDPLLVYRSYGSVLAL